LAMVDEEFHIYNLGREYRSRSWDVGIVGWELRATLAGLLEDFSFV
jgi:hypothetical protein